MHAHVYTSTWPDASVHVHVHVHCTHVYTRLSWLPELTHKMRVRGATAGSTVTSSSATVTRPGAFAPSTRTVYVLLGYMSPVRSVIDPAE